MFNKTLKKDQGGFVQTEPHQRDQVKSQEFLLLRKCSTMYLFCNSDLVENITKAGKKMTVQGNGGTLAVGYPQGNIAQI